MVGSQPDDMVEETPADYNKATVKTGTDQSYDVAYVFRHPDEPWLLAKKVTEVDNGTLKLSDLLFRADHVEMIDAQTINYESSAGTIADPYWIHRSVSREFVDESEIWKGWPGSEEQQ